MNNYKKHICKQCGKVFFGNGTLCRKHSMQLSLYGHFLDSNPRSQRDLNEIIIHEDYADIITYDKYNNPIHTFKISLEDVPFASKYKWYASKPQKSTGLIYLVNSKIGLYHRIVMNAVKGQQIDHINMDTFDNRRSNLRIANQTLQNHNQHVRKNIRFDIKGIDMHRDINRSKRFMARFSIYGKTYRSPWFTTYEEAVFARYLLEQLSDIKVFNGNMSQYINKLSDEQKQPIIKWFTNRFKDRV
jgi:hypothetical protein